MKRLITLAVAGCMMLGFGTTASAIDVQVKGQWQFSYGYYSHYSGYDDGDGQSLDPIHARMRARTQIDFIASESLRSHLNFEIGNTRFGNKESRLDADYAGVKVKRAYMDWTPANTSVSIRMGVQGVTLPNAVSGNPVLNADVAGITASTSFTPEIGMTAFWLRPFDEKPGDNQGQNTWDEMDVFGFTVPIKTQAVRVTPWAMVGSVGKDTDYNNYNGYGATSAGDTGSGRGRWIPKDSRETQSVIWWAGTSFELPLVDPFVVKLDAMYGRQEAKNNYETEGYLIVWDLGYKWNWGKTSVIGFYGSGDNDKRNSNTAGDYGTIPIISNDTGLGFTPHGLGGGRGTTVDTVIDNTGRGMWAIGAQVADVSFMPDLKHTFTALFMRGTNSGERLGGNNSSNALYSQSGSDSKYMYLISSDSVYDISLRNEYKINEYLTTALDLSYIHLGLSDQRADSVRDTSDIWAGVVWFQYSF